MAKRGTTAKLNKRTLVIVIAIMTGLVLVAARLLYFQTVMSEELQKRAVEQQLSDTTLSARRGSIYDKNGNLLAQSLTVWNIVTSPVFLVIAAGAAGLAARFRKGGQKK